MINAWKIPKKTIHKPLLSFIPYMPSICCVPCNLCKNYKKCCTHVPISLIDSIFDDNNSKFDDGSLMKALIKNLNLIIDE